MKAYDGETSAGEVDLVYGRIDRILEDASKTAGLTKTQFKDWGQIARVVSRSKGGRGRSLPERKKNERGVISRVGRDSSARRRDHQRKADEDRKRKEEQDKKKKEQQKKEEEDKKKRDEWEKAMRRDKEREKR